MIRTIKEIREHKVIIDRGLAMELIALQKSLTVAVSTHAHRLHQLQKDCPHEWDTAGFGWCEDFCKHCGIPYEKHANECNRTQ